MGLLTRDDILSAIDLQTVDIDVPEWGGTVRIKALTASQRDEFESVIVRMKSGNIDMNLSNYRARLAALSIVDDTGRQLFSHLDIRALGEKSAAALDRVFDAATTLNGIGGGDVAELTERQDVLEKNSETDQGDDLHSA